MTSDAIALLKADHKEIRRLFREFQGAATRHSRRRPRSSIRSSGFSLRTPTSRTK